MRLRVGRASSVMEGEMIAAFLCGLMFGALAYRAWCVRPITLKGECEPWDGLSDEALANFDRLASGPFDSNTDNAHGPLPGKIVDGVRRL